MIAVIEFMLMVAFQLAPPWVYRFYIRKKPLRPSVANFVAFIYETVHILIRVVFYSVVILRQYANGDVTDELSIVSFIPIVIYGFIVAQILKFGFKESVMSQSRENYSSQGYTDSSGGIRRDQTGPSGNSGVPAQNPGNNFQNAVFAENRGTPGGNPTQAVGNEDRNTEKLNSSYKKGTVPRPSVILSEEDDTEQGYSQEAPVQNGAGQGYNQAGPVQNSPGQGYSPAGPYQSKASFGRLDIVPPPVNGQNPGIPKFQPHKATGMKTTKNFWMGATAILGIFTAVALLLASGRISVLEKQVVSEPNKAFDEGWDEGYDEGYDIGMEDGYDSGWYDGYEDAEDEYVHLFSVWMDRLETPYPENGEVLYASTDDRPAPFTVVNPTTDAYYIVFYSEDGETQNDVLRFFVAPESTAEVKMPLGDFKLKMAYGDGVWYGEKLLFGGTTKAESIEEGFSFSLDSDGYWGNTLTLMSDEGNLNSEKLPVEDF